MSPGQSAVPTPRTTPRAGAARAGLPTSSATVDAPDAAAEHHTLAGTLLLLLLAGLALFDRPLAVLSVPGVPIYPGEIVLSVCVVYLLTRRSPFKGVRAGNWMAPTMLVVWLLWGLTKFLTSLHYALLDVIRDSALVYYALFALVVVGLSRFDSRFQPKELVRLYGRFIPWLLAIAPFRIIGQTLYSTRGPVMPGTSVQLTDHRPGNLGCALALAVVYLASSGRRDRAVTPQIVAAIVMIVVIGTQNRGGLLSATVAIAVALVIWGRHVRLRLLMVILVMLLTAIVAWGANVSVQTNNREVSVTQLVNNLSSVVGGGNNSQGQVNATVSFRETLWKRAYKATIEKGRLEAGWGFGPNLGSSFLPDHSDKNLRNPHNSHITVLIRLGLIGVVIWVAMWATWLWGVIRRARRARRRERPWTDRPGWLAFLAGIGVVAILVNAYVDPTLETPMVAVWLWSLFGFGMIAVSDRWPASTDEGTTDPVGRPAGTGRLGRSARAARVPRPVTTTWPV